MKTTTLTFTRVLTAVLALAVCMVASAATASAATPSTGYFATASVDAKQISAVQALKPVNGKHFYCAAFRITVRANTNGKVSRVSASYINSTGLRAFVTMKKQSGSQVKGVYVGNTTQFLCANKPKGRVQTQPITLRVDGHDPLTESVSLTLR